MRRLVLVLCCFLIGCANRDPIEDAKTVIRSHEEYASAGDLEGVTSNVAEDVVVLTPETLLVKGKQSFREFYAWTLSFGKWDFVHEYQGAETIGDGVVVHGIVRGSLMKRDSTVMEFANNFIITLRYQPDGHMKFWRIAYAPGSRLPTQQ